MFFTTRFSNYKICYYHYFTRCLNICWESFMLRPHSRFIISRQIKYNWTIYEIKKTEWQFTSKLVCMHNGLKIGSFRPWCLITQPQRIVCSASLWNDCYIDCKILKTEERKQKNYILDQIRLILRLEFIALLIFLDT